MSCWADRFKMNRKTKEKMGIKICLFIRGTKDEVIHSKLFMILDPLHCSVRCNSSRFGYVHYLPDEQASAGPGSGTFQIGQSERRRQPILNSQTNRWQFLPCCPLESSLDSLTPLGNTVQNGTPGLCARVRQTKVVSGGLRRVSQALDSYFVRFAIPSIRERAKDLFQSVQN